MRFFIFGCFLFGISGHIGCQDTQNHNTNETSDSSCPLAINNSPTRGPADAWITIIEFSDFECPFCRQNAVTLDKLLSSFPEPIRLVFKHFPLPQHNYAYLAAMATICAHDQQYFWAMHDIVFSNQKALKRSDLLVYADEIGLDLETWQHCMDLPETSNKVQSDIEAGRSLGVNSTPTLYVNGTRIVGSVAYDEYYSLMNEQIESAKNSGASSAEFYDQLLKQHCDGISESSVFISD